MGYRRVIQLALLGYVLVVLAVLTLSPFRFAVPQEWVISWLGDSPDMPKNFLLFIPVGYFFSLSRRTDRRAGVLMALLFGACVSLGIEVSQLFLVDRLTSLPDWISNCLGAASGAALCHQLRQGPERPLPGVLTLDLPLVNILYLLLPLMWLAGAVPRANDAQSAVLLALGISGALIFAGLWRSRRHDIHRLSRSRLLLLVAGWFLLGSVVGLTVAPMIVLQSLLVVLVFTLVLATVLAPAQGTAYGKERRFEGRVLAMVWPAFVVYLLLSTGLPLPMPQGFDFAWGYPQYMFDRTFTLGIAEQLGALILFGYLLGESFGRSHRTPRVVMLRNLVLAAFGALVLELVHGFLPADRASVMRGLLGISSAWFGVALYAVELDLIQLISRSHVGARAADLQN